VGQSPAEVVRRAAAVFAGQFVAVLVDLAEGAFDERRRRAEKCHRPHREQRTGAAERDGRGDAGDVAGPDRPARDIVNAWKLDTPEGDFSPLSISRTISRICLTWTNRDRMEKYTPAARHR